MIIKKCTRCKEEKSIDNYFKASRRKDGLQPACKKCMNGSYKRSRAKKQQHYNEVKNIRRRKLRDRFEEWKSTKKCIICEENDTTCLDFHHLDPAEKDINIANVSNSWPWDRLQIELNKCVVLCANCHRKVHAQKITLLKN